MIRRRGRRKLTDRQVAELHEYYYGLKWSVKRIADFMKIRPPLVHEVLDGKGAYEPVSEKD